MYIYEYDILLDKILNSIFDDLKKSKIKKLEKIDIKKYISCLNVFDKKSNYDKIILNTKNLINMYIYFNYYINNIDKLDDIKTYLIKEKIFDTNNLGYLINLFKNYNYLNNVLKIINNKEKLLEFYKTDVNYKDIIDILNEFGIEEVNLQLLVKNMDERNHNTIKLLIFKKIYSLYYRKNIFNLIFLDVNNKHSIDIIVPKVNKLDYFNVESLLTYKEKKLGLANDIINMFENLNKKEFDTNDQIIDSLLNTKLVIPITDEFLRFHKIIDKMNMNTNIKTSRIKNILFKNEQVREFYSLKVRNNKTLLSDISKLFYKPLLHRQAILYNEYDELNIIQKILLAGSGNLIDNNDFLDLKNLRKNSYVNFKNFKKNGINYLTSKNFTAVRYAGINSLENKTLLDKNAKVEFRNINKGKPANIVGLCLLKDDKIKLTDFKNIREINKNGIEGCKQLIQDKINNKLENNYYWIFDEKNDILIKDDFDLNINNFDINVILKYLLDFIRNQITILIKNKLENYNSLDFYFSKKFVKYYSNKYTKFHINRKNYNLNEIIKSKNKIIKKIDDLEDEYENKIYGIVGDVIKKTKDNENFKNENIYYIPYFKKKDEIIIEDSNVFCQHLIDWNKIKSLKSNNINLQKELIYKFVKKYVITNLEEEYICKSCKQYVDVKNYLVNEYDGTTGIDLVVNTKKNLSDIREYEKYSVLIKNLDKLIERIARINNLNSYIGNEQIVRLRREDITKNIIDLIKLHEKTLKVKNMSNLERQQDANRKYNINNKYTNFFIFGVSNDLFKSSSEEKDKFKKLKLNTIVVYIILFMILDLSESQIVMLEYNKLCNNIIYEKLENILFKDIKIIIDDKLKTTDILHNKLLCFLVYYFSCNLSTTNTWYSVNKEISIKQKAIIHTFFDFINSLLEVFSFKNKNYFYEILCLKIINKINLFHKNKELLEILNSKNDKNIKFDKDKNKILIKKSNINSINLKTFKTLEPDLRKFNFNNFYLPKKKVINVKLDKQYLNDIYLKYQLNFENKILSIYDENGFKRNQKLDLNDIKKLNNNTKTKILKNYKSTDIIIESVYSKKVLYKKIEIEKNVLDKFIVMIQKILKKDDILINNNTFHLTRSKLNIKFDFLGNIIKNNLQIFIDDNKIISKNNTFFNKDVYEIYDKVNDIKLILNKYNLHYLGYLNKNEITDLRKLNLYAIYVPSIKEQFETLGFKKNYYNDNENLNHIVNETINNIKMYILLLKNNLYLIKYKKINESELIDYYINRIINLNMHYDNKNLFHDVECIQFSKNLEKITKKYFNIISKYELKNFSKSYCIILNYYIQNIIKLIEINNNEFVKLNILEFIIKNNYEFYKNNYEQYYNFEIIKYKNIYNLDMCQEFIEKYDESEFLDEMDEQQKEDMLNEQIDDIEKDDALDIDDIDNEDDDEEVMFYNDEN